MKVMTIVGTRPEIIKLSALYRNWIFILSIFWCILARIMTTS